ncbi:MAG: acyl-CoA reductase, partial [Bacteroidota bacterium]
GKILSRFTSESKEGVTGYQKTIQNAIEKTRITNPWFTPFFIQKALKSIASSLKQEPLEKWINQYPELKKQTGYPRKIGVVNAGNLPFVGFHDFLSVLLSGNIYYGKLSSKDQYLPKAIAEILTGIEPEFKDRIIFEKKFLKKFDAIIATGSNNTSRYFHYYFSKYPHIIRKNRNGTAVLTGTEDENELSGLGDDIFLYFGMGCRNVSKLYVPRKLDLSRLLNSLEHYRFIIDHHKYANNYDYNKAAFTINKVPHLDNGFILLKEDEQIASPVATLYYERYDRLDEVRQILDQKKEQIQCIVTRSEKFPEGVYFGKAQHPALWDYADNIDTIDFLLSLSKKP